MLILILKTALFWKWYNFRVKSKIDIFYIEGIKWKKKLKFNISKWEIINIKKVFTKIAKI